MDFKEKLKRLLSKTATNPERVRGLLELGLAPAVLAMATSSSASTLRNWSTGSTQPRAEAAIVLDDLRLTARTLLDGLEPERVALWFTSRDPDYFDGMRPIEMISHDPMTVLAAAHETLLEADGASRSGNGLAPRQSRPLALVGDEGS